MRLKQHQENALKVANWLSSRDEVDVILHPAFESCPGHDVFKRDFTGSNGLFSFVLNRGDQASLNALLDGMHHFKMGYSWGGFESLILGNTSVGRLRTATTWQYDKPLIRVHIGLENPDDLIDDLAKGFDRLNAHLSNR